MDTALLPLDFRSLEKLREQELEEARVIQNVMMPAQPLRLAGVTISHEFQPVTEVGGDYLDYFKLSDDTIGLYVGDVSGKGLPAALYAALAVGTLRGIHKTGMEPERVLSLLNHGCCFGASPGATRQFSMPCSIRSVRGCALSALECPALFSSAAKARAPC